MLALQLKPIPTQSSKEATPPTLSVRLEAHLYERLKRQCEAHGLTMSEGIRQLISMLQDIGDASNQSERNKRVK